MKKRLKPTAKTNGRRRAILWSIMLRPIVFGLAMCLCAHAQFSGLATPGDGSRVYFATQLRQKNTAQPLYGKVFTVDGAGLKLYLSRDPVIPPPTAGAGPALSNAYNLQAARISSDGKILAVMGIQQCEGPGEFCTRQEPYVTTIGAGGQDKDYPGDLRLSAGGAWAFGVSGVAPVGIFTGYLVNVTTGERTTMGGVFGRFQVASSGRPVADDGTAVYSDFDSVVVARGSQTSSQTRHIDAGSGFATDAVTDRSGATIVFAVCESNGCSLRLADAAGAGSRVLAADGFAPSLSDDGKTLLYLSTRTGSTQIRVGTLTGGAPLPDRQLGFEVGGIALATLSGDGSTVYAVTKNGRLEKLSAVTGAAQELIPRTASLASVSAFAPGKLVTLGGGGLTDLSFTASPPLPESLNGVSMTVQGIKARILSVAPDAILAVVPPDVTPSADGGVLSPVEITVTTPSPFDDEPRLAWNIAPFAPEFATGAADLLLAAHQDWSALVTADNPAHPGEVLHGYGFGLGATTPAVAYGSAAPAQEPLARLTTPFGCIDVSGAPLTEVEVVFQGLAPTLTGVYQFDFRIPVGSPSSNFGLSCVQGGVGSGGPSIFASVPVEPAK